MCVEEQKVFENLLTNCKLSFTVEDGLYMISHGEQLPMMLQTKGYNLPFCVKRVFDNEVILDLLH